MRQNGKPLESGLAIEIPSGTCSVECVKEALREGHKLKHMGSYLFYTQDGFRLTDDNVVLLKDQDTIYIETQERGFDYRNILELYSLVEQLGQGGFGKVHKVQHRLTGQCAAIKYIDITDCSNLHPRSCP